MTLEYRTAMQLRSELLADYKERFVCSEKTDLVVEGFPRSANSYTVDFLTLLARRAGLGLSIAHHTHDVRNLRLGHLLGKPLLVIVRDPKDVIPSVRIFSRRSTDEIAKQWVEFYASTSTLVSRTAVIDFAQITANFNTVVSSIRRIAEIPIPLSLQHDVDRDIVLVNQESRGRLRWGKDYERKAGVPSEVRSELKKTMMDDIDEYLKNHPRIWELYLSARNRALT